MRYVWLAILIVAGAPLLYVGFLLNPSTLLALGVEGWRERLARLQPYRRWVVLLGAVFSVALAVYLARYG